MGVPCPEVIVPPLTVQIYVPPGPASGTEATMPLEPSHSSAKVEMVASGLGTTVRTAGREVTEGAHSPPTTTSYKPKLRKSTGLSVSVAVVAPETLPPFTRFPPFRRH